MGQPVEDRLVAACVAARAPVTRPALYDRFSDDFDTEGDLAKVLGRLVADGRLLRDRHVRPDSIVEFVYRPPGKQKAAAAPALPQPPPQEPQMSKTSAKRQRFIDHLVKEQAWRSPAEIASALKEPVNKASYHLNTAAALKQLQAIGNGNGRKFAALGLAAAQGNGAAAETATVTPKRRRRGTTASEASTGKSARTEVIPMPIPGEAIDDVEVRCAIEDTGFFAINDGKSTIRLKPKNIRKVIHFLTLTQHVWKDAA